ncbi:MAG: hypothetical protein NNA22_07590 [Nitrospira sp.]|nr:hypothetical protein [Nitrospira sp.]
MQEQRSFGCEKNFSSAESALCGMGAAESRALLYGAVSPLVNNHFRHKRHKSP